VTVRCSVEGCGREAVAQFGSIALCEHHLRKFLEQLDKIVKERGE